MDSELLSRRLSTVPGGGADDDEPAGSDGAEPSLRWLPDELTPPGGARAWMEQLRADPGRAGVLALGAVGVLAVLVTVFTVLRQPPAPVSANLPPVQMVSSGTSTAAAPQSAVVSVVGLVQRPGLVTVADGARIADVLDAAGGAAQGADLAGLNIARRVADGDQIVVGVTPVPGQSAAMSSSVVGATGAAPTAGTSRVPAAPGGKVNLNTATEAELDALPGIGPVMAASIVRWRSEHGKFSSVDQLSEIGGIGPARLDRLRALVTV